MSRTATATLSMFLLEERPTAVRVTDKPKRENGVPRRIVWLARSQIGYARKSPAAEGCDAQPYTFTLPEWKVEEQNLWPFAQT